MAESLRQLLVYLADEIPIFVTVPVEVSNKIGIWMRTVFRGELRLGILLLKPLGRSTAWRSNHDIDAVLSGQIDSTLHPVEVVHPLLGLQLAPGELAYADQMHMRFLHQVQIGVPSRFGPLLRVPGCAQ